MSAAGPDRQSCQIIGRFHCGELRRVGTQSLFWRGVDMRLTRRLDPQCLGLLQLDAHLGNRKLFHYAAATSAAQIVHCEVVRCLRQAEIGR